MGDVGKRWWINGRPYSPVDIASLILKKLISDAQEQIGPIGQAVVTVPAQFSDAQRHATVQAAHAAGLEKVDVINEPVAAALCYVLGSEGLWFTELAGEQRILVYDLGGGTFDLSLVRYRKNEVTVLASSGDLNLGGINWNRALLDAIADQFNKEFRDDPRDNPETLQALALEVEQAKRSLSVRPKAALACAAGGHRKSYQVEIERFQRITKPLVDRTEEITLKLLKDNKLGWAHVDVVLVTGGASRMPMIRGRLKQLSGRTLNTTLSPDLSIAHGATYYAGMLLSNDKFARSILSAEATKRLAQVKQQSVSARGLGILVRDLKTQTRVPHYLIPPNSPLPKSATTHVGTVIEGQERAHLVIIESGTTPEQPYVVLGDCRIEGLPAGLPEGSRVEVTISYDPQARVHVAAKEVTSGKSASTEIIRQENLVAQLAADARPGPDSMVFAGSAPESPFKKSAAEGRPVADLSDEKWAAFFDEGGNKPIALCNDCGTPLDAKGACPQCAKSTKVKPRAAAPAARPQPKPKSAAPETVKVPSKTPPRKKASTDRPAPKRPGPAKHEGEDDFWKYVGE
jgi:molecular chaperone DnaK